MRRAPHPHLADSFDVASSLESICGGLLLPAADASHPADNQ